MSENDGKATGDDFERQWLSTNNLPLGTVIDGVVTEPDGNTRTPVIIQIGHKAPNLTVGEHLAMVQASLHRVAADSEGETVLQGDKSSTHVDVDLGSHSGGVGLTGVITMKRPPLNLLEGVYFRTLSPEINAITDPTQRKIAIFSVLHGLG